MNGSLFSITRYMNRVCFKVSDVPIGRHVRTKITSQVTPRGWTWLYLAGGGVNCNARELRQKVMQHDFSLCYLPSVKPMNLLENQ